MHHYNQQGPEEGSGIESPAEDEDDTDEVGQEVTDGERHGEHEEERYGAEQDEEQDEKRTDWMEVSDGWTSGGLPQQMPAENAQHLVV